MAAPEPTFSQRLKILAERLNSDAINVQFRNTTGLEDRLAQYKAELEQLLAHPILALLEKELANPSGEKDPNPPPPKTPAAPTPPPPADPPKVADTTSNASTSSGTQPPKVDRKVLGENWSGPMWLISSPSENVTADAPALAASDGAGWTIVAERIQGDPVGADGGDSPRDPPADTPAVVPIVEVPGVKIPADAPQ